MEAEHSYTYTSMMAYLIETEYDLEEMIKVRLPELLVRGLISTEEYDELVVKAKENASAKYASIEEQSQALTMEVENLKTEITQLKNRILELEGTEPEEPTINEYSIWKQPTGAHDAYYTGDKMTYTDGNKYECVAPKGYGVTYGPDVLPEMWKKVEEQNGDIEQV